jgi:poly-gamma-glutamate synthesis protein (capsule biosynthesis protein)
MMASKVEDVLKANGFDYPYRELGNDLMSPDLTIANFESPVTTGGKAEKKDFVYRTPPAALPDFVKAGFDVVNLANNHILDYGTEGLLDTFKHLDAAGLKYMGAGHNIAEAYKPAIVESKGIKIAFLGFSRVAENQSWYATASKPGIAQTYAPQRAIQAIQSAREQADLVVVFAHWGKEREDKLIKEQPQLAQQYIDNGADLVVASHPHVLQGFESYKGKWIAYSLGNFLFTTNTEPKTWETAILNATCTKEGVCSLNLVPVWNQYAKLTRMDEPQGLKLFKRLSDLSINAEVDSSGTLKAKPAAQSSSQGKK